MIFGRRITIAGFLRTLLWLVLPMLAWLALRRLPFGEVWEMLSQLDLLGVVGLLVLNGIILALFSSRSWLILRTIGYCVPYLALTAYRLTAFSVSYFTPGQQFGGEPLQVYWLQRRHPVSKPAAMTTVMLDKVFELLANFTFLSIGILTILRESILPAGMQFSPGKAAWLLIFLLVPLGYLLALRRERTPLAAGIQRLPAGWRLRQHAPSIQAAELQTGTLLRDHPALLFSLALASGVTWVLSLAEYWLMVRLLGISLTVTQAVFALTAARLAFLTPLPGGLGALEAGQVLAMQTIGLNPALGISISLLIRARDISLGLAGMAIGMVLARAEASRERVVDPVFKKRPVSPDVAIGGYRNPPYEYRDDPISNFTVEEVLE